MQLNKLTSEKDLENISIKSLLIQLINELNKSKEEIKEIKKWINIKKKKIVILDWLNNNYLLETNLNEFIENLEITQKDILFIFKTNLIEGIINIFNNMIKENITIPIKSFVQKENQLYYFNSNNKWEILNEENLNLLLNNIYKLILKEFEEWQSINKNLLLKDEYNEEYLKNIKKILGGNITLDDQKNKIKKNLYKILKLNLVNILEYEFS